MAIDAERALQLLLEGNQHFVTGTPFHPHQGPDRRRELAVAQAPFAAVLACIDSRVSPEIMFDAGLGDLLVVRVAGNVLDDIVLGSLEFGVRELGIPLIAVVGHQRCGAITGAVNAVAAATEPEGRLSSIVDAIRPAIQITRDDGGDRVDAVVRANCSLVASWVAATEPILADAVRRQTLRVVSLYCSLDTGRVEVIA